MASLSSSTSSTSSCSRPLEVRHVSNFSYPRQLQQDQRSSLGSDASSAPGMMTDDCSSSDDLSGGEEHYDPYHASGAELWDSFWPRCQDVDLVIRTDGLANSQSQDDDDDVTWPLKSPRVSGCMQAPPRPQASYSLFPGPKPCRPVAVLPMPPPVSPPPPRRISHTADPAQRLQNLVYSPKTSSLPGSPTPEDIIDFYHTMPSSCHQHRVPPPRPPRPEALPYPPRPPSPPRISVFEIDSDSDSDESEAERDDGGARASFTRLFARGRSAVDKSSHNNANANELSPSSAHVRSRSDGSQRTAKAQDECRHNHARRRARADTLTAMGRRLWDAAPALPTPSTSSSSSSSVASTLDRFAVVDDNRPSPSRRQGSDVIARMLGVRRSR